MLTGLAFLVACTGPGKLTRAEKKQLKKERTEIVTQLQKYQKEWRIDAENSLISIGPSIALDEDKFTAIKSLYKDRQEEQALLKRLMGIDQTLKNNKAATESQQKMDSVQDRINMLQDAILNVETPKLYGPPPVDRTDRQRMMDSIREARSREDRGLVYGPPPTPTDRPSRQELDSKIEQLQSELDSVGAILQRREGACVYGSPEVIEKYKQESNRLKEQFQRLYKELDNAKNERKRWYK